jgi:hypothetical protein
VFAGVRQHLVDATLPIIVGQLVDNYYTDVTTPGREFSLDNERIRDVMNNIHERHVNARVVDMTDVTKPGTSVNLFSRESVLDGLTPFHFNARAHRRIGASMAATLFDGMAAAHGVTIAVAAGDAGTECPNYRFVRDAVSNQVFYRGSATRQPLSVASCACGAHDPCETATLVNTRCIAGATKAVNCADAIILGSGILNWYSTPTPTGSASPSVDTPTPTPGDGDVDVAGTYRCRFEFKRCCMGLLWAAKRSVYSLHLAFYVVKPRQQ